MTIYDCIDFSNQNPICYLATAEDDQPHVRALGSWFADETGFYFQTGSAKEFPGQLRKNPKAEICIYKHEGMLGTMLRISGKVEFLNDPVLKKRVLHERPFLKSFGLTVDSPELIIFRIAHGEAHFWTMETNMKKKEFIKF